MWRRVTCLMLVTSGAVCDQEAGEAAKRDVGVVHAARTQDAADLLQVAAHRGRLSRGHRAQAAPRWAAAVAGSRRTPGWLAGRMAGEDLGVDDLGGLAVLGGQPVIGQVQVDPGGLDRGVPGLGLHGFECHAGLPEPGQAGVAQLVAGRVREAGAASGAGEDLVQSLGQTRAFRGWGP